MIADIADLLSRHTFLMIKGRLSLFARLVAFFYHLIALRFVRVRKLTVGVVQRVTLCFWFATCLLTLLPLKEAMGERSLPEV